MKTLFLQCAMGAAGDMLMAALYELLEERDRAQFLEEINALGIPGVKIAAAPAQKCGIWGTHMDVTVYGQEEHSHDAAGHAHLHGPAAEGHAHAHEGMHDHAHDHTQHDHGEHLAAHEHAGDHDKPHAPGRALHMQQPHAERVACPVQGQGEAPGSAAHPHEHAAEGHDHLHESAHAHPHGWEAVQDHAQGEHGHMHPDHAHSHAHGHPHSGMAEIEHLLSHLPLSEKVRADALSVYHLIAEAESHAHGQPISEIHFHEVGTLDAVADVVGVCMLIKRIGAQKILASPVHVGSGQVRCAHGILPVPAPATAHILQGVPTYGGSIQGELCTPTGAALLKHFVQEFAPMPALRTSAIGYGMGTKDFEAANCVRAFLGEDGAGQGGPNGEIALLSCNLDDMTGEALGFAEEALFAAGALDVFTLPIQMKKNRPGVLLCCICQVEAADELACQLLKHTTTFGVRKSICQRYMLSRGFEQVQTPYGALRIKTGQGYGVQKSKPEYEDAAGIAREQGIPLASVMASIPPKREL